jgi:hypothetical protein
LRKHTTSAAQESVRIPAHSLGLAVEKQGNDTAIVDVAGIGKVELRVQDLVHVSLVIDEVEFFKYLGLNLEHALRMEEATETGVANIHFAHSKVAVTLHSLKQLPRRGNNAALSPRMRLQMWRSCVLTIALENLWYLRTKGQVHKWQTALSLSETYVWSLRTTPANGAGSGNPTLALQQAKQLCALPIHIRIPHHSACTTIRPQSCKQKLGPN